MTTLRKPEWFFVPAWIILTALCVPIALFFTFIIIRMLLNFVGDYIYVRGVRHITEDYWLTYLFPPLMGLATGFLQYGLLRRYLPHMGGWVLTTVAGWLVGLAMFMTWLQVASAIWQIDAFYEGWAIDLAFVALGASIGTAQWLLLRRRLSHAGWWIGANVLSYGLLGLLAGDGSLNQYLVWMLALLPAGITAVTFSLLINQTDPPFPQLQSA
ncbi:MAG TPA: hypothetical protein PLD25_10175 [Chloroflexota bacterium]|nr:hypothetical protein [Chloroflexota bacterium]HUM70489.1 hypothetical protein [Chloroflexota bacterium]